MQCQAKYKRYRVHNLSVANYLVRNGFDIKGVIDNKKIPHYKLFLFDDSESFRETLSKYNKQ